MNEQTAARSSNLYQDDDGRPRLRDSAVVWLDILGFQHAVTEARARGEEQRVLEMLAGALKDLVPRMKPSLDFPDKPPPWVVKGFTDNFVLGFPLSDRSPTRGMPELSIVLDRAGRFQLELAQAGFFVRGGVAVGPLYMDENLVYGAALIEAYEAESKRARDPRVILTPSARAVVDKEALRWIAGPRTSPDDASLWQDVDGQVFVNYLYGTIEFEHDVGYPDVDTFVRHGDALKAKLTEYMDQPEKWVKYAWVARYHNAFLDLRHDFPEDSRIAVDQLAGSLKPYS